MTEKDFDISKKLIVVSSPGVSYTGRIRSVEREDDRLCAEASLEKKATYQGFGAVFDGRKIPDKTAWSNDAHILALTGEGIERFLSGLAEYREQLIRNLNWNGIAPKEALLDCVFNDLDRIVLDVFRSGGAEGMQQQLTQSTDLGMRALEEFRLPSEFAGRYLVTGEVNNQVYTAEYSSHIVKPRLYGDVLWGRPVLGISVAVGYHNALNRFGLHKSNNCSLVQEDSDEFVEKLLASGKNYSCLPGVFSTMIRGKPARVIYSSGHKAENFEDPRSVLNSLARSDDKECSDLSHFLLDEVFGPAMRAASNRYWQIFGRN